MEQEIYISAGGKRNETMRVKPAQNEIIITNSTTATTCNGVQICAKLWARREESIEGGVERGKSRWIQFIDYNWASTPNCTPAEMTIIVAKRWIWLVQRPDSSLSIRRHCIVPPARLNMCTPSCTLCARRFSSINYLNGHNRCGNRVRTTASDGTTHARTKAKCINRPQIHKYIAR